jgi:glutamate N-acetyltransferase / amino-acid N-acetyltransferase
MTEMIGSDALILPAGFRAAGSHVGIKRKHKDLALFVSDLPAAAAGTFTTNRVQGAPVRYCRQRLSESPRARAIVVNSGIANTCTGRQGMQDAERMAARTADALGTESHEVLVCSTGRIGERLPMDCIEAGLGPLAEGLSPDGGADAEQAILTTDTIEKHWTVRLSLGGTETTIAGCAKGAGMIEPNMATMLAFLFTDAAVHPAGLSEALRSAVDGSFNRVSVDGDRSTNDTVLILANGAADGPVLDDRHPDWPAFQTGLADVCRHLARKIVLDGEGATKFVTVRVKGAASPGEADRAARAVANSLLVKTGWSGGKPSWGRVMDALGYSGAEFDEGAVGLWYDDVETVRGGASTGRDQQAAAIAAGSEFTVTARLGRGSGTAEIWTCDCTEEYVRINA